MSERSVDITRQARLLARGALKGAFATTRRAANPNRQGQPYVSKVSVAWDASARPLFLFSTLAAHTQDIMADPRASLLVEAPAISANPQEDARATLVGKMHVLKDDEARAARGVFLAHHAYAEMYAGFGDFSFWSMSVEKVHFVGGFGASVWGRGADFVLNVSDVDEKRDGVIDSLNSDGLDDVQAVLKMVTGPGQRVKKSYRVAHIDGDGLSATTAKGGWHRVDFNSPAKDLKSWRARWRGMVKRATQN